MSTASTSFKRRHLNPQSEGHLETGVSRAILLQAHLVILIDRDKDLRKRDVLSGVEIEDEILVREHLVIDQDPLAREDAAEVAVLQHPALHDQIPAAKGS